MSLSLGTLQALNWRGQLFALPIALCTPLDKAWGPKEVRIDIPWTQAPYLASLDNRNIRINVNLANQQVKTPLDAVRFVKIDNSFNDVAVYLQFSDSQDGIICPANSIVGVPVMSNVLDFSIAGFNFFTGKTPVTSVFLSNAPQDAYFIPGTGQYKVTGALLDAAVNNTNAAVYNFPNVKLGRAFATRKLVALVAAWPPAAPPALNSIVINGVTCPALVSAAGSLAQGRVGIGIANVPTGVTGTVTVTFAGAMNNCFMSLYAFDGVSSASFFDTNSDDQAIAGTATIVGLNTIPGAVSVWGATIFSATASDLTTWSVLNANVDSNLALPSETCAFTCASYFAEDALVRSCATNRQVMIGATLIP